MRELGRSMPLPSARPHADALRRAAAHQATGQALARLSSTGIPQGVYRFNSHAQADAQVEQGLARVMAANASRLKPAGGA